MKILTNLAGGLTGAVMLNIIHETYKRMDHDAPRIDLVGEEVISEGLKHIEPHPLAGNALYTATLVSDLVSNALYFSFIGYGDKKYLILRGLGFGFAAGVGAVKLTKPLGLSDAPVTRTDKTKALTVAWYIAGGLAAALIIKTLSK